MSSSEILSARGQRAVEWAEQHTRDLEPWPGGPFERKLPVCDVSSLSAIESRFKAWVGLLILRARRQGALHCSVDVKDYVLGLKSEFDFSQTLDLGVAGIAALKDAKQLLPPEDRAVAKIVLRALHSTKLSMTAAGVATYGHAYVHGSGMPSNLVSLTVSLGAAPENFFGSGSLSPHADELFERCPKCGRL